MSILQIPHAHPRVILFDWHATLADTMDAMYYALDDVMPRLAPLGLIERLVPPGKSKTIDDARLVKYVRENAQLHPKIKAERKISRTDIFELLFGDDQDAKAIAHREFDKSYERHFGVVKPMEADARRQLLALKALGIRIGVLSNRARRFMAHEIYTIDGDGWHELFDTMVCGDDVERRKPHPDLVLRALDDLQMPVDLTCWYVGDSTTDIVAAREAGVSAVFYNGAGWDRHWIDKIFPGTVRHPHVPDAVVADLAALVALARRLIAAVATH
ncbi:HAD family hydrolase [Solimonas terrae]|uniref:phosphoglycolate phosphatase n=1 Tax=Solimonas terrae TaxID=1396819 RepID=A0A6M2BQX5_9GAMM|nr:HAD-IA family hydrolase [Solimonas terrae]NGY04720.1 HAD-IA family hydrolase [Solimonas terrae]